MLIQSYLTIIRDDSEHNKNMAYSGEIISIGYAYFNLVLTSILPVAYLLIILKNNKDEIIE